MNDDQKVLLIPKIENGIVIDHIPAGYGIKILEILHKYPEMKYVVTTLGLNCISTKLGKKDLIKLQTHELLPRLLQHISLVCPGVTIKRIKDYAVEAKFVTQSPEVIQNLLLCKNPNCITNGERHLETCFKKVEGGGELFKCNYCERIFNLKELKPIVI